MHTALLLFILSSVPLPELKVKPLSPGGSPGHLDSEREEEGALPRPEELHSLKSQGSTGTPSSGIGTGPSSWLNSQHPLKGHVPLLAELGQLRAETGR